MLRRVSIGHYSLGYTTSISDGHIPIYDLEVLPRSGWTTLQDNSYRMGLFDGEFIHIYDTGQLVPDDVTWIPLAPEATSIETIPSDDDRKTAVESAAQSLSKERFVGFFGMEPEKWLALSDTEKEVHFDVIILALGESLDSPGMTIEELSYVAKSIAERSAPTDEPSN